MELSEKILKHQFKDLLPAVQPIHRAQLYRTLQSWAGEVKGMETRLVAMPELMEAARAAQIALKSASDEIVQLRADMGVHIREQDRLRALVPEEKSPTPSVQRALDTHRGNQR